MPVYRRWRGGAPFEGGVRVVVWTEKMVQFGVPCLRGRVEPAVERVLGGEDDGLTVVQPRKVTARRRRDDCESPEWFGLTCATITISRSETIPCRLATAAAVHAGM